MTKHEIALIAGFMDNLGDVLGNRICNDLILANTEENRDLVYNAMVWNNPSGSEAPYEVHIMKNGNIITHDCLIVGYLKSKLMEEYNLSQEDVVVFE